MEVGLGLRDIVLAAQIFGQCPLWQTAGWTKMPLGMELDLGPGDFVFDGDRATPRKKGTPTPHPIFGPCLFWPNGWMDQDATWYGGKLWPRRRCVRLGHSSPLPGAQPPVFSSCLWWANGWMDEDSTWCGSRHQPRPRCIRRGPSSPQKGHSSPLFSAHIYCGHGRPSQLLLSCCLFCSNHSSEMHRF